jgi:hypothetical protein
MYHVISAGRREWRTRVFADEMRSRCAVGYQAVTLGQVDDAWRRRGPLPRHPIDDGYRSHCAHAKPVLGALGWPGVLNLQLDVIAARSRSAR